MFTPSRTASTAPGPDAAASGSSTRVAGRLLMTFASTADRTAVPSSAGSAVPCGTRCASAPASPLSTTARTTMPSASTNARNGTAAERTIARGVVRRWARARAASTRAPASAAQAGSMPSAEVSTKPASVPATVTRANSGICGAAPAVGAWAPASRSVAKNRRSTTYSTPMATSHGSTISAAKRVKLSPLAVKASRLVRLETGSSSEAVFDRWVQA